MSPVSPQMIRSHSGDPTAREMADETMKMPEPIMVPATSIVASVRVMAAGNVERDGTLSPTEFVRAMTLTDATMLVAGTMIGSGIFIVSSAISRAVGSPLWLLIIWGLTGLITLLGALAYGELAAMYPRAGGQYVFLRESMGPLMGFLYGWTLF